MHDMSVIDRSTQTPIKKAVVRSDKPASEKKKKKERYYLVHVPSLTPSSR
jgi:hypothetical protein